MNKHLHRIIFNAARGMRMVVQETATSIGKGAARGTVAAVVLIGLVLAGTVRAQIVGAPNVPGHLRPTVLVAPNGVPLVNIQTPSAAGVSRNVYYQFDVMRNGAILNNSRVNVQTQLGGFVQGNPWLARGPARVILNEINSGNPTQLRGHVEVGGQRAEVIIANPAGISVDGGGFINASRATLTTGVPQLDASGGLDSFVVRGGTVSIEGAGLDAGKTDYAAILARAVQVNAGIWANELRVVAGANQVGADHGGVTPIAGNGAAPAFALDVAALGGMYAQKITLVGTEAGLGVRNAGNAGAAAGLVVTAQGRLENTGTLEGARVEIHSGADIDNRSGTIRQTGGAGLTIDSPVLSNTNGGVIGAGPSTPADVGGTGTGASTPSPSHTGGTGVGNAASPSPAPVPSSTGFIAAAGTLRNDGGRIYAGGPITLKTPQIDNAGGTLNVATMAVSGASFSNARGTLNASQNFDANVGRFDNTGGTLNAGSLHIDTSGELINVDGKLASGGDASLAVGGRADNTRGTIAATGRLTGKMAKEMDNSDGSLVANGSLALGAAALDNTRGSIQSVRASAQLEVAGHLNNAGGAIGAGLSASVKAGALASSGTIRAGSDATLGVATTLANEGRITAGRHTAITAGSLASGSASVLGAGVRDDGELGGAGDLSLEASGTLAANGTNVAAGNAVLQGTSVDLSKSRTSASNIAIAAAQGNVSTGAKAKVVTPGTLSIIANAWAVQTLDNDAGALNAGRLALQAPNIVNTRGGEILQIGADATTLAVSGILNNAGGRIAVNGRDLTLDAGRLENADGRIEHAGSGTLRITGGSYSGAGGRIASNGALAVELKNGFSQDNGRTEARQITIDAASLRNRGGQLSGRSLSVDTRGGDLDNGVKGTIAAAGALVLRSGALNNDMGSIRSGGSLQIDTNGQLLTNTNAAGYRTQPADQAGGITSGGTLSLKAGEVKNTAGSIESRGALIADTQAFDNSGGGSVLGEAGVSIVTNGARYDNSGGTTRAVGSLNLDAGAGTIGNSGGLIRATETARLVAGRVVNSDTSGGEQGIEARNVTVLGAAELNNVAGRISAVEVLRVKDQNAGSSAIRALAISNTDGVLMAGQPAVLGADGKMRDGIGGVFLDAKSFSGDGRIASANDLGIALVQDVTNNAKIDVNGNLNFITDGKFTNNTKLSAGQKLTVGAGVIDNAADAEMSGRETVVKASTTLTNRGLIDSQGATQVDAGTLFNIGTGRIYGNAVSAAVGTLDNSAETANGTTRAATIAARESLNIGADTVRNREHALIFSAGIGAKTLNIGGKLDGNREATTSGSVLENLSARIESLGGMTISMGRIDNIDTHIKLGPKTTTSQFSRTIGVEGIGHFKPEDVAYTAGKANLQLRNPDGSWRRANGHVWGLWDKTVLTTTDTAIDADPAAIVSGGNMVLNGNGLNQNSRITAGGMLTAPGIRNEALKGEVTTQTGSIVHWRATRREPDVIEPTSTVSKDVGAYEKTGNVQATRGYDAVKAPSGATGASLAVSIVEVPSKVGMVLNAGGRTVDAALSQGSNARAGASQTVPMVVRTSSPRIDISQASLFNLNGGPRGYLVEADPRFAGYRNWLSSDYLLNNIGQDPGNTLKRLGDGFYEQKLIREQVAQLTGYRYLGGYYNDEEQYTALMNNGASFAREYGLRPGIVLSEAQMAQLTSDIVWLVEKTVKLPDGGTQKVLAPQLYVRVRPGDIDGSGALLSADTTVIKGDGDLVNTGTVAGRVLVRIDKDNVRNLGGRIAGGDLGIRAKTDLDNIGGSITASSSATLTAGRDINIETTTRTQTGALTSRTNVDRVAGVYVSDPDGTLAVSAWRDVRLAGAILANAGTGSKTQLKAGRDIIVSTVKEEEHQERGSGTRNSYSRSSSLEVGSQIVGGGDVTLDAENDIRIRGSVVDAQGDLAVKSRAGDARIEPGRATVAVDSASEARKKGLLSSKTTTQRESLREDTVIGSALGGRNVVVSGRDVTVSGSEIIADKNAAIVARRDLTIEAAQNTRSEGAYRGTSQSGLMGSGGFGFTIGSRSQSTDTRSENTSAVRSTVGSIGGNTTLIAGNRYMQIGSDVVAPDGDVTIAAKSIAIREAREASRSETEQKQKTGGLTVALTASVINAVQSVGNIAKAVQQTGSSRMQALGAASMAVEAKSVADALANASVTNPAQSMGVNLSISLGGSQNRSNRTETSDTAAGSRVEGKNVSLLALGGGKDSNILVQGSDIRARDTASLVADNRIDLLAAQNTSERHGTNKGSGGSVGVSFGTSGLLFNIGANGSRGKSDGTGTSYTNSHVSAGNKVSLASGGDTTIKGGVIEADRVAAKVGGDLKIESLQDTGTSASKQQSLGGSLSVGIGVWSVGVSASSAKAGGSYASVKEQSGIKAGDGGFDVDVKGRTDLKGAVIESTQAAVDNARNTFKSASLTTSDIQNFDSYKASGASLGLSVSGQQPKGEDKKPIPGSDFKVGSGGSAGVGSASGNQSSVTKAGISGIAGDQSVRTGVDSTNALTKKWDTEKLVGDVQAQAQITQAALPKAAKAVGDYADGQTRKYERAQLQASLARQVLSDPSASDEQRAQAGTALTNANSTLAAEQQNYDNWKEGGASRTLAHAVVGGLAGNLQGAVGAALASAAAPVIDDLTRDLPKGVKEAVGAGLAVGLGATTGSASGATTAFNADINNRQSNAAQRDALARLQKDKGEADQKKLADAMCALLKCAAGADPNSAGYAAQVSSQNRGADYKAEQKLLLDTGVFSNYGWTDGAIDIASRLLHNARDEAQGAASGAGYLGNAVAQDFKLAVAAANPPAIPPDLDNGGKPPAAGGSSVVVGLLPTVWCASPACVPGLAAVVPGGRLGYVPGNTALSSSSEDPDALPGNARTSNQSSGASANILGKERELKVAEISGGKLSNEKIITSRGHTDVDVVGPNGELIGVGGPAKLNRLPNLGGEIAKLKEEAAKRGVVVQYYITDSTPRQVYDFLIKRLGVENVFIFKEP
ncbi:hemagglutinin repeat-containing protein [uncultured Variovorax sp.]|uniref:hemagglutinin repeat-containing protein n=1 Tax=uncultured Variovorax sp. TaxID=114708 RepID=UPI0025CD860E|nr:hemagglutinin repeat-containing protein [uncultured Variovorax sp.]